MIVVDSLTIELNGKSILHDFSMNASSGEKIAISGESGSGKSTLLKALIGMHVPKKGGISISGFPLAREHLEKIRRQVFYLPQDIVPQGDETTLEYLKYPFSLKVNHGRPFPSEKVESLFLELRLKPELLAQPLYKLSGGERKRVGLMSGLLLERPIVLADEPTAGVDSGNRDIIAGILFGNPDTTVVAVTHDEELIKRAHRRVQLTNLAMDELTGERHGRS